MSGLLPLAIHVCGVKAQLRAHSAVGNRLGLPADLRRRLLSAALAPKLLLCTPGQLSVQLHLVHGLVPGLVQ